MPRSWETGLLPPCGGLSFSSLLQALVLTLDLLVPLEDWGGLSFIPSGVTSPPACSSNLSRQPWLALMFLLAWHLGNSRPILRLIILSVFWALWPAPWKNRTINLLIDVNLEKSPIRCRKTWVSAKVKISKEISYTMVSILYFSTCALSSLIPKHS